MLTSLQIRATHSDLSVRVHSLVNYIIYRFVIRCVLIVPFGKEGVDTSLEFRCWEEGDQQNSLYRAEGTYRVQPLPGLEAHG